MRKVGPRGGSLPSLVVGVEAGSVIPGRHSEVGLLLAFLFDVLCAALDEESLEGPGSALRPIAVVVSASGFPASASEFSTSASDVVSSAVKATVLNELGPGDCLGAGSVDPPSSLADKGGHNEALAEAAFSIDAARGRTMSLVDDCACNSPQWTPQRQCSSLPMTLLSGPPAPRPPTRARRW